MHRLRCTSFVQTLAPIHATKLPKDARVKACVQLTFHIAMTKKKFVDGSNSGSESGSDTDDTF